MIIGKRDGKAQKYKDQRVNAPLITWKVYLILLGIQVCIMVIHTWIVTTWLDKIPILSMALIYYGFISALVLALLFGFMRRYVIGKPLEKISEAARRLTSGEFSVRIAPIRRDGRKDEVEVLIDDFNTMAKELESTEMLKNDFISNVSHEIKTPLSVIQNYASAIKMSGLTEQERNHYADVVIGTTKKLSELVVNILRLSKLQNQEIAPEPETYQLGEQIRQCALGYMDRWEQKKIKMHMEVIDVSIRTDRSLMELVWNNLLSNAIKFTGEGGSVFVRSGRDKNHIWVEVQDTGCGIPEDALTRIFDKFYQVDTSHATEGNGLGLALVKRILSVLSGEITVKSVLGEGTVFTVRLPV